jgi:amino-acid N-acetyltransferase
VNEPVRFRPAEAGDLAAVRGLLTRCELPAGDLDLATQRFVLACDGAEIVGSIALEPRGSTALLRSLAVTPSHRGRRLGEALYDRAVALATRLRVGELYLLTTTAERFFARRGFVPVDRAGVPAGIAATSEFATVCCASARCMHLSLAREPPDPSAWGGPRRG